MILKTTLKRTAHDIFYKSTGQKYSVANYWNDPHHQAGYLKHCQYLPLIDNVVPTSQSSTYKENFIRLGKLVLIGGPDDGVITPWQSRYEEHKILFFIMFLSEQSSYWCSHFGVFAEDESVIPMEDRAIYIEDLFGLKTIRHKTHIYTIDGVTHHHWHQNISVIDNYILPHLD